MYHSEEQLPLRCVIMRGGTSKGLYFHADDLPPPGEERDRVLKRVMGAGDLIQIDGLGGSRPITSKVAIVARSQREDADLDYTFAQVGVDHPTVTYSGNCGNISSGVAPFAIDEGLCSVTGDVTSLRIHNTNTGKILIAHVPTHAGVSRILGHCRIPGIPGAGAEILMDWSATIGAKTGVLLPTGNARDTILLENGRAISVTLCDAGNPCGWVLADEVGMTGSELPSEIDGNASLISVMQEIRAKLCEKFGLCTDWRSADEVFPSLPMVGVVAPPKSYKTFRGEEIAGTDMDLRVRLMFMQRCHESIAGSGSICLAAASRIPGSVVAEVLSNPTANLLRAGNPSGVTEVRVSHRLTSEAPGVVYDMLGFSRTARRLMAGVAYVPVAEAI